MAHFDCDIRSVVKQVFIDAGYVSSSGRLQSVALAKFLPRSRQTIWGWYQGKQTISLLELLGVIVVLGLSVEDYPLVKALVDKRKETA